MHLVQALPFPLAWLTVSDALSNIESSNISSFDDIFFIPTSRTSLQLTKSSQTFHGVVVAQITQNFVRPSTAASVYLLAVEPFFR